MLKQRTQQLIDIISNTDNDYCMCGSAMKDHVHSGCGYSMLHRVDFDEPYHTEMVYRQHQVLEALHNAGINVTEAGKGEAS